MEEYGITPLQSEWHDLLSTDRTKLDSKNEVSNIVDLKWIEISHISHISQVLFQTQTSFYICFL